MAKYIEREALIEWLKRIPLIDLSDGRGLCRVILEDDFKKAIKKMPKGIIAEVEPVRRGRWIYNIERGECVCSACGKNAPSFRKDTLYGIDLYETCLTDYCPNCGARMDEEA